MVKIYSNTHGKLKPNCFIVPYLCGGHKITIHFNTYFGYLHTYNIYNSKNDNYKFNSLYYFESGELCPDVVMNFKFREAFYANENEYNTNSLYVLKQSYKRPIEILDENDKTSLSMFVLYLIINHQNDNIELYHQSCLGSKKVKLCKEICKIKNNKNIVSNNFISVNSNFILEKLKDNTDKYIITPDIFYLYENNNNYFVIFVSKMLDNDSFHKNIEYLLDNKNTIPKECDFLKKIKIKYNNDNVEIINKLSKLIDELIIDYSDIVEIKYFLKNDNLNILDIPDINVKRRITSKRFITDYSDLERESEKCIANIKSINIKEILLKYYTKINNPEVKDIIDKFTKQYELQCINEVIIIGYGLLCFLLYLEKLDITKANDYIIEDIIDYISENRTNTLDTVQFRKYLSKTNVHDYINCLLIVFIQSISGLSFIS